MEVGPESTGITLFDPKKMKEEKTGADREHRRESKAEQPPKVKGRENRFR